MFHDTMESVCGPERSAAESPVAVTEALWAARERFLGRQSPDGRWLAVCRIGAMSTAYVVIARHFLGELSARDAEAAVKGLGRSWLGAGRGFEGYPGAGRGDLSATALVWAALRAAGVADDHPVLTDARDFVEREGGVEALLERMRQGDMTALFMALVGLFPVDRLVRAPAALMIPGAERALEARLNVLIPYTLLSAEAITRFLRTGRRPLAGAPPREGLFGLGRDLLATRLSGAAGMIDGRRCLAYFDRFNNEDGSWLYGDTYNASLTLVALTALGVPRDDPRVRAGLAFLDRHALRTGDAGGEVLTYSIFETDVWTTAFVLRALMAAGASAGHPAVARGADWLCRCQRNGTWAFQARNTTMPDCDDAGVVLATLGMVLDPGHQPPADPALTERVVRAIRAGRDWLFSRQNREGGWASYQYGLPGKPRGPIMTGAPPARGDHLWANIMLLTDPPPDLGDPATEDLTGRVLFGLGRTGSTEAERPIARAVEFLRVLQDSNGGWWGRWTINYLASTAWVLRGLSAVKADLTAPWVKRGVRFLLEHQNADGGWGETPASYYDLQQIARGPSTPGLSGLVVSALLEVDAGAETALAVSRGVAYLLSTLGPEGAWPVAGELHCLLPPRLHYELPETENQLPLEALATYRRLRAPAAARVEVSPHTGTEADEHGGYLARLERARFEGDSFADEVVVRLFENDGTDQVNRLFRGMLHNTGPLPAELPEQVRRYFAESAALPAWTDPVKLDRAQALFARCGFGVATGLFCSSLPQCFAFPDGAKVLGSTTSFGRDPRRRVVETAQFVFDVAAPGALGDEGRAVRAAQKVRLMHAAVRVMIQRRGAWDEAAFGVPIGQQQMLGTMIAFSIVVTDALTVLGFEVRDDEAEAWFHLWRVVGALLGIDQRTLPATTAEARGLMEAGRHRYWGRSPEGPALAKATLAVMQELLPAGMLNDVPVALVRHLAGDRCADLLDLPTSRWATALVKGSSFVFDSTLAHLFNGARGGGPGLARVVQQGSFALMKAVGEINRDGKEATFQIPAALGNHRFGT